MMRAGVQATRERGRERSGAYRERRRQGLVLVSIEVGPRQIAALERLALLDVDNRDKASIAWAVSRFGGRDLDNRNRQLGVLRLTDATIAQSFSKN
jgi:hypothetical protein